MNAIRCAVYEVERANFGTCLGKAAKALDWLDRTGYSSWEEVRGEATIPREGRSVGGQDRRAALVADYK